MFEQLIFKIGVADSNGLMEKVLMPLNRKENGVNTLFFHPFTCMNRTNALL